MHVKNLFYSLACGVVEEVAELIRIEDYCFFEEHAFEDSVEVEVGHHIYCLHVHFVGAVVGEEDHSHIWKDQLLEGAPVEYVMVLVEAEEVDCA